MITDIFSTCAGVELTENVDDIRCVCAVAAEDRCAMSGSNSVIMMPEF
jgi:hypothetical protein